mgnify:CR=1 FL=1
MDSAFSLPDLLIVLIYLLLVIGIGFYFSRREATRVGYFLAGRDIGWLAIGASLFATNISSEHLLGLAGTGSKSGLAVGHFELLAKRLLILSEQEIEGLSQRAEELATA